MSMSTSEAGKRGGSSTSPAKRSASAANGKSTKRKALITKNAAGDVWRVSYRGKLLHDLSVGPMVGLARMEALAEEWALANGFDGVRWAK